MVRPEFLLLSILGLALFYFGSKMFILFYRPKTKIKLSLDDIPKKITISNPGLYSIGFIGTKNVLVGKNVSITLFDANKQPTPIQDKFLKITRTNGVDYWSFIVEKKGAYELTFKNSEKIFVKKSLLSFKSMLGPSMSAKNLQIIIRSSISNKSYLLGIISLVFGFNLTGWGIILTFALDSFQ